MKDKNIGKVKFTSRDQAQWFLLISDLLTVGFSLRHALTFTQTSLPRLAPLIKKVQERVQVGKSVAQSLAPYVRADTYYQLDLAEKHGDLQKTLRELGTLMQARQQQYQKLKQLLQYPLILLALLGIIVVGLVGFVYPELRSWQTYPANGWLANCGEGVLFILAAILSTSGYRYWRWRHQARLDQVVALCRLPIVGQCYQLYFSYYLVTNLATLLRHGMSLQEILQITANFRSDALLHQLGQVVGKLVKTGRGLEELVYQYQFVPNELIIFINKGASREELGADLTAFAKILFQNLTQKIARLLVWVQPVIFAFIAVVIVILYLSILMPIYHSMTGVL